MRDLLLPAVWARTLSQTILAAASLLAYGPLLTSAQQPTPAQQTPAQQTPAAQPAALSVDRLFEVDRLTDISIELAPADWDTLRQQNRDVRRAFSGMSESPFTYFRGNITVDGVKIESVGIRKKGFLGSLDDQFPSLKIKFDEYTDQDPIRGVDTLTLNNNKQDPSLVSQFLAYRLFNAAGVQAPRCSYVRVTVNGQYLGVYTHVESIGKPFVKRRFGNGSGNLYEGTLADFHPQSVGRLDAKTADRDPDHTKVKRLADLLNQQGELPLADIERVIDVDNFLKFWAMESLIGFWDGYASNQNNFWIYDNRDNNKLYFLPWGADGAFLQPGGMFGFGPQRSISVYAEGILANRLYHQPGVADRYRDTMRWLLANTWHEDELIATVDRIEKLVSADLHQRQRQAPQSMRQVRQFIRQRRAAIERELDRWPAQVADRPRTPVYVADIGVTSGSFAGQWTDTAPPNPWEVGSVQMQLQLEGQAVKIVQAGVSAHPAQSPRFPFGFPIPEDQLAKLAHVVIMAVPDTKSRSITLTLSVDREALSSKLGQPIPVEGTIAGTDPQSGFFNPFGGRTLTGTMTFTKAGLTVGDACEGTFDLKVTEIRGGFGDRQDAENKPAPPANQAPQEVPAPPADSAPSEPEAGN